MNPFALFSHIRQLTTKWSKTSPAIKDADRIKLWIQDDESPLSGRKRMWFEIAYFKKGVIIP